MMVDKSLDTLKVPKLTYVSKKILNTEQVLDKDAQLTRMLTFLNDKKNSMTT